MIRATEMCPRPLSLSRTPWGVATDRGSFPAGGLDTVRALKVLEIVCLSAGVGIMLPMGLFQWLTGRTPTLGPLGRLVVPTRARGRTPGPPQPSLLRLRGASWVTFYSGLSLSVFSSWLKGANVVAPTAVALVDAAAMALMITGIVATLVFLRRWRQRRVTA